MASSSAPSYWTGPLPRIIAHRGLAVGAPENSALAFVKAMAAGASHLETDVHASVDGVSIISHDPTLLRSAGRKVRVDQLRAKELLGIDLGGGQRILSLREALQSLPDARFNIDIKADAAVEPTVRAIRDERAIDRVLITSFSESRRSRAVELLPGVASSASAPMVLKALARQRVGLSPAPALRGVQAVQVPERHRGARVVSRKFIHALHNIDVEVHVWTINDPHDMIRLLDLGIDGIVTDRADLAVSTVASRS